MRLILQIPSQSPSHYLHHRFHYFHSNSNAILTQPVYRRTHFFVIPLLVALRFQIPEMSDKLIRELGPRKHKFRALGRGVFDSEISDHFAEIYIFLCKFTFSTIFALKNNCTTIVVAKVCIFCKRVSADARGYLLKLPAITHSPMSNGRRWRIRFVTGIQSQMEYGES